MNLDLAGKRVLVTGGSRGIGYAVAGAFAAVGADVTILAEREEVFDAAKLLTAERRREVGAIHCDVTDFNTVAPAAGPAVPDGLLDFGDVCRTWRIGDPANAAVSAIAPPNMSAYAASKGGLEAMLRSFARELGPRGINVNAVAPGMVTTELTLGAIRKLFAAQIADGAAGGDEAEMIRQLNTSQAIHGTPIDPDRLAQVYVFLASPHDLLRGCLEADADLLSTGGRRVTHFIAMP